MNTSIFDKLYRYREKPGKGDFENFCTEVFAYALEGDAIFRNAILERLGVEGFSITEIKTQHRAGEWGIPDLLVETKDQTVLLFEVKVESAQGDNQLKRYADFLQQKYPNHEKYLIFLTKYYEATDVSFTDITLQSLRWYQVHHLITSEMSNWAKELQNFLKTNDMANVNKFTVTDLATLSNVNALITKMDEVLNEVQPHIERYISGISGSATRSTRLQRRGAYENFRTLPNVELTFGFSEHSQRLLPECHIRLKCGGSGEKTETLFRTLGSKMKTEFGWEFDEADEYGMYIAKSKFLGDFMSQEDDELKAVAKFMKETFDQLVSVKDEFKELF